MKKIFLLTLILLLFVVPISFAEENATTGDDFVEENATTEDTFVPKFRSTLKLGIDMSGDHEVSAAGLTGTMDTNAGFSLSTELTKDANKNLTAGIGMTAMMPRSQEDVAGNDTGGNFMFIPIYGVVKIYPSRDELPVYAIGQAGYNFFFGDSTYKGTGDLSGGLYYGAGIGFNINETIQLEALYSVNNGTYSDSYYGIEADLKYSKLGFSVGFTY